MALFKIEKGLAANLATNRPNSVEGYCYFTSDDGKFYIDIATGKALTPTQNGGKLAGATRMPINSYMSDWAARAYADKDGNDITSAYGNRLSFSDKYTLKLIAPESTELSVVTLPKDVDTASKFTSAQTVKLTGAVTGTTSSQAGWTVATTLTDNIVKTAKIADKAVTNEKLANSSITIGGKAVNLGGTLTLADIGLNTALRFIGATSTAITDGSTTSSIVINGSNVTPTIGDVIINNNNSQEYVWLGSAWELLGDESSYALKTITISGSNGLTGSGSLSGNITLSHADTSNQASISASGRRYITGMTLDTYGHVTGLTTGTETVTDTHYTTKLFATGSTGTAHAATTNGNTYLRLFDNSTARQSIKIVGGGATTVTSDANGVITISSTDNNTTYDSMSISEGTTGAETINRVLNAANLKGIINAHAPTKTGTGASGNWGISVTGNAATATKFDTATNVTLTGDITGSYSSQKGWNIKTTIGEGKVTNAMLAGSISNDKLANSYFTIKEGAIDHNISLGGQVLSKDLATWLGLSKIMSFVGISNDTKLVNGYTGTPTVKEGQTNYTTKTPGDTILHETTGKQFIWTGSSWYEIGNGLLYDLQGTAAGLIATLDVSDTDGGTNNFVSAVKQTDGKINVTHKALVTTGKWAGEAGSVAWANVTDKPSTFTPSEHTHNYAGSSSAGGSANSAIKVNNNLIIKLNGGSTEGTNLFTFNGSTAKTINITPAAIGASASGHTHNYAGSASVGGSANSAVKLDTATAGNSNTPVYFSGGKPVACTSLDLNTSGNAATATNADKLDGYHASDFFINAGSNPTCGNGTAITQPGGAAIKTIRTTNGGSRDVGIFYLSEDNAYIANSSDNAYTFGVFDTDLTQDFSSEANASFSVSSNGTGCKIRGNTVLHAGNYTDYTVTKTGSGASGTWGISISGNASTATKATQDGDGNVISSTYAKLQTTNNFIHAGNEWTVVPSGYSGSLWLNYRTCGGTNGNITEYVFGNGKGGSSGVTLTADNFSGTATNAHTVDGYHADRLFKILEWWSYNSGYNIDNLQNGSTFVYTTHGAPTNGTCASFASSNPNYDLQIMGNYNGGQLYWRTHNGDNGTWNAWRQVWNVGDSVTGAVWNDYAECRESNCEEFGYVLMETGDDSLTKTTERLSHFAGVSSDTWGFSQGETQRARTPIAVAGRVLVYPYQDRNNYKPGDCVCAAPGGTVDIMTREEVREWPDRIVGTVSCVPDYEEWGGGKGADREPVKVNGRIWIKVK